MKKGSIITPSDIFVKLIPLMLRAGIIFSPSVPQKGGEYTAASDPYIIEKDPVIDVEEVKISHADATICKFKLPCWKELLPPLDVQELVKESIYEKV